MKLMADRIRAAMAQQPQEEGAPAGMQVPPDMAQQGQPGQEQGPISLQQVDAEVNRIAQENPEVISQVRQEIAAAMNTGELTPQELNQAVQLARAAMQNPEIYPQLRSFALQQGVGSEEDIPPQYDQGFLAIIVMLGQAMQQGGQDQGDQSQMPVPSFAEGGAVMGSAPGASLVAEVHDGEFVFPADVVRRIGLNKLEKMVESEQQRGAQAGLPKSGAVPDPMAQTPPAFGAGLQQ